jgi:hypothetical protein
MVLAIFCFWATTTLTLIGFAFNALALGEFCSLFFGKIFGQANKPIIVMPTK